jgi:alpha-L-arabinofuranosidase
MLVALVFACEFSSIVCADVNATIQIDVDKPGAPIPPNFNGLMTEEINHSYDGGLLAELIQNRTFQDPSPQNGGNRTPIHWAAVGSGKISTDRDEPVNSALPLSLRLDLSDGEGGVANDGYWGIPVRPDTTYTATFYAKGSGGFAGPVKASIRLDDGDVTVGEAETAQVTGEWKKYAVQLTTKPTSPTTAQARFVLSAQGSGRVSLSCISLFPPTYKNTPNGLRPDIMQLLAELQPKFIRLPGGNYVEGSRIADRFNWKEMIGPPDQRPGHMGCWSYRSSDGFGLPEYLLWCKQLGAQPVLALFAGYTLDKKYVNAGSPDMARYTQEALEEIEYVGGAADSEWGRRRAADGFPEPFPLRYVEIGNEDWFDRSGSYDGRFTEMATAIRQRYPNLKIIATAPVKSFKPDLYDDHYYRGPRDLREMFSHYDKPTGPAEPLSFNGGGWSGRLLDGTKSFVGEWAAHDGRPTTNLNAALADAAFVMGLERNSDVVEMQCYAPLLANVNPADPVKHYPRGWQWEYNLIGYDALGSYGSPSYHAQVMLAQNKGDVVLDSKLDVPPVNPPSAAAPHGMVGVGSYHTQVEYGDLTVTAPDGRVLLSPEQALETKQWTFAGEPWQIEDKSIRPSSGESESWALTGDAAWEDYTIKVRARKLGGPEGFIVIFHAADGRNYQWVNFGGWGNTLARTEAGVEGGRQPYGPSEDYAVETGRWYDLRLEVTGNRVRGFVEGKLVIDSTYKPRPESRGVYASATYARDLRTVIMKAVNAGSEPVDAAINVRGVASVEPLGTAIVLTGDADAVNTVSNPLRIAPQQETFANASTSFHRTLPAHSFTILRLKESSK